MAIYSPQNKRKVLREIIRGCACNLMAEINPEEPKIVQIEFPAYLLQDIQEKTNLTSRNSNFPILKRFNLPSNFDFKTLLKYFDSSYGRLGKLKDSSVEKITNVYFTGKRVHLDVLIG